MQLTLTMAEARTVGLGYAPGGLLGEAGSGIDPDHTVWQWAPGAGVERSEPGRARSRVLAAHRSPAPEGMGRRSECHSSTTRSACTRSAFRWTTPARSERQVGQQGVGGYCQVDEKLVDRPPRYWARASREPVMLGIRNGRQPQLDNTVVRFAPGRGSKQDDLDRAAVLEDPTEGLVETPAVRLAVAAVPRGVGHGRASAPPASPSLRPSRSASSRRRPPPCS